MSELIAPDRPLLTLCGIHKHFPGVHELLVLAMVLRPQGLLAKRGALAAAG